MAKKAYTDWLRTVVLATDELMANHDPSKFSKDEVTAVNGVSMVLDAIDPNGVAEVLNSDLAIA